MDDTDLFHLDMQRVESAVDTHECLQEAVIIWGKLLIATGGALKPEKCSCYLISFKWKADGTWLYDQNELNLDFTLGVPMADGSLEEAEHLTISKRIKTLGSMTFPPGSSTAAIERMKTQGQEWVDRVLASSLSCRNVWFMVDCQFGPRLATAFVMTLLCGVNLKTVCRGCTGNWTREGESDNRPRWPCASWTGDSMALDAHTQELNASLER